jgi:hypothetical protein
MTDHVLINQLRVYGDLGHYTILSGGIKSQYDFVTHIHEGKLTIYGIHGLPIIQFKRMKSQTEKVQSFIKNSYMERTPDGRYIENGIHHSHMSKPDKKFLFHQPGYRLTLKLIRMELFGQGILEDVHLGHFNSDFRGMFEIGVFEQAQLACGVKHPRIKIQAHGHGIISGFKKPPQPSVPGEIFRWNVEQLHMSLYECACVKGITVKTDINLKIPDQSSHVSVDVFALNNCRVSENCNLNSVAYPHITITRKMDPRVIDQTNQRRRRRTRAEMSSSSSSFSSSSSSSIIIHDDPVIMEPVFRRPSYPLMIQPVGGSLFASMGMTGQDYQNIIAITFEDAERRRFEEPLPVTSNNREGVFEVPKEVTKKTPPKFLLEGNTGRKDYEILNRKQTECSICQVNRAIVAVYPCGQLVSCLTCIQPMQYTLDNCPLCRVPIQRAEVQPPSPLECEEAFQLIGDSKIKDTPGRTCLYCEQHLSAVIFDCGHSVCCIECSKKLRQTKFPQCKFKDCEKDINVAIIVIATPSPQ